MAPQQHKTKQFAIYLTVIPAHAGIHFKSATALWPKLGKFVSNTDHLKSQWFPACTRMTVEAKKNFD